MRTRSPLAAALAPVALLFACSPEPAPLASSAADDSDHSAPSAATARANAAVAASLPLADAADFEAARRGLLAQREDPVIRDAQGREVWNLENYDFESDDPPDSVNPSLWRQAQLNRIHGLFQVSERIYQVRGYDLANMTLIAGDTGWIIIDALTTRETAQAALELVKQQLGERPVKALLYTHSHIDHFGGAGAVLSPADLAAGVPVIAPKDFLVEAVSENVLAGTAMSRRASYMFGFLLHRGARGHVDSGLGKASTPGTFTLVPPTEEVGRTGMEKVIDGVRMVFQYVPGSEAPTEMMIYLPEWKAFCGAEDVTHTLHNLYTLRGAKVRDALLWSNYIDEAIRLFGDAEVLFASHHWPTWGNERIVEYLKKQRDAYKYIHDQTLRLANHGLTPTEIAEQLALPEGLASNFATRDYYGTVSHDSKAVYQYYFGWFDGNPANLHALPPQEESKRTVEYMGGADAVVEKARAAYEQADYRWVATVLNHVVFAQPEHRAARELLADTYDQLGYQAESGPWRDFYLTGAKELRHGRVALPFEASARSEVVRSMPTGLFFDALAVRLNGEKAVGEHLVLNFEFTDIGETHVVEVENAVLHHWQRDARDDADATLELTRATWNEIATGAASLPEKLLTGELDIDGSRLALVRFFGLLDDFDPDFEIVRP